MAEPQLSRDAREYRVTYLKRISEKASEETALVLAVIYTESKKSSMSEPKNIYTSVTIDSIIVRSMLSEATIRRQVEKLEFADFIQRKKVDRTWLYSITMNGYEAMNFMVDEEKFPGRKAKINAILNVTKRQGNTVDQ